MFSSFSMHDCTSILVLVTGKWVYVKSCRHKHTGNGKYLKHATENWFEDDNEAEQNLKITDSKK